MPRLGAAGERGAVVDETAKGRGRGEHSLNQRIRSDIERRILSGEWGPGHKIPFEHELMAEYGCARMTVSKVLSALAESGLIERRRRAGSFVRRPGGLSAVLQIPDIKIEVAGRGAHYGYERLTERRRRATKEDRALIPVAAGTELLALTCRHLADGVPAAAEDRLIVLDAVPDARLADFAVEPPGTWLLNHVPWHEAENRISAVAADEPIAGMLGLAPGAPCLLVERTTWRSGQPLTFVRVWYPGDRQKLVARFTPAAVAK